MKKIIITLLLLLTFGLFIQPNVVHADGEPAPVTYEVLVDAAIDDVKDSNVTLLSTNVEFNTNVNVTAAVLDEGYQFAFWIINGAINRDLPQETTFIVTNHLKATAVFYKDKVANIYIDANGTFLKAFYGEEPEAPTPSNKVGYNHNGWTLLVDEALVKVHRAKYALITEGEGAKADVEINGNPVRYNQVVEYSVVGEEFTHWENEHGKVISYNQNFKFSALTNMTLVEGTKGIAENLVTYRKLDGYREGHSTHLVQFELLDDFEIVEYGLLVDGVHHQATNLNPNTNELLISITDGWEGWNGDNTKEVKGYMLVKDNEGNLEYVYNHDKGALKEYTLNFSVDGAPRSPHNIYVVGTHTGWDANRSLDEGWFLTLGTKYEVTKTIIAHQGTAMEYKYMAKVEDGYIFEKVDNSTDAGLDRGNRTITFDNVLVKEVNEAISYWPRVEQSYTINFVVTDYNETGADNIYVVGTFVDWDINNAIKLSKDVDGKYRGNFTFSSHSDPGNGWSENTTTKSTVEYKYVYNNKTWDDPEYILSNRRYDLTPDANLTIENEIMNTPNHVRIYFDNQEEDWPGNFRVKTSGINTLNPNPEGWGDNEPMIFDEVNGYYYYDIPTDLTPSQLLLGNYDIKFRIYQTDDGWNESQEFVLDLNNIYVTNGGWNDGWILTIGPKP